MPIQPDDTSPIQEGERQELDPVWGDLPEECRHLTPKYLLNGFPKSGLHLVTNMMRPIAAPMPRGQFHKNAWLGTFGGNSWTTNWISPETMLYRVSRLRPGMWMKGHIGYSDEIELFLRYAGVATIFVFRDLRDVAVSQAHHILSDIEGWLHPQKDLYRKMDSFDDVLAAVIGGLGKYAGVVERWKHYAPWLDVPWVLKVKFEDLRNEPEEEAGRILRYGVERVASIIGCEVADLGPLYDVVRKDMADASRDTSKSPTFRKGQVGGWRDTFTEDNKRLFKETDDGWLIKLGYEDSDDW